MKQSMTATEAPPPPPIFGLVLTGGRSERMAHDKALLPVAKAESITFAEKTYETLSKVCAKVFLSARKNQWNESRLAELPSIEDQAEGLGPIAGIGSAFNRHPDAAWFVVAVDLPRFNLRVAQTLTRAYSPSEFAVGIFNTQSQMVEPLCAIYSPRAGVAVKEALHLGRCSPRQILERNDCKILREDFAFELFNVNTQDDLARFRREVLRNSEP